jgi:hypothetical protein
MSKRDAPLIPPESLTPTTAAASTMSAATVGACMAVLNRTYPTVTPGFPSHGGVSVELLYSAGVDAPGRAECIVPLKRGLPSSLLARGSYPPGTPCAFSGSLFQRAGQAIETTTVSPLAQLIEQAVKLAPDRPAHAAFTRSSWPPGAWSMLSFPERAVREGRRPAQCHQVAGFLMVVPGIGFENCALASMERLIWR